ncbi:TetR/AcrR family transcriptional regulator [Nocardia sp. NPDC050378]|uniref:TetR/AcrR family transcriptional regulator n=1 Tax=Nocardia sp. NPDC050378 TaxID=3155400 RepID=UPI0033E8D218
MDESILESNSGGPASSRNQWATSERTRNQILDTARDLFSEVGYADTSINDIVVRSGVSVGSIYHHIGGKPDLFEQVARRILADLSAASHRAVEEAREAGESDAVELYLVGASAYLAAGWKNRKVNRLLLGDDRPRGFAATEQELNAIMMARMNVIVLGNPPAPEFSAIAIQALLRAAAGQLVHVEDQSTAEGIIDYYIGLLRTLAYKRPH